ncbi:MAG: hypothetical protein WCB67_10655 [Solirubrobacteraceae bacterium]
MRTCGAFIAIALLLSACGASLRPSARAAPPAATAFCDNQVERHLAKVPLAGESGVYSAGPVTLSVGEDLAQAPRGPSGTDAIMVVRGGRPVSVRVLPSAGARLSLEFARHGNAAQPGEVFSNGAGWVRFPSCGHQIQRVLGGVYYGERGCARVAVKPAGGATATMLIPIGNSLRGCPAPRIRLSYAWSPFLGVACGKPNWMGCDRIGIGVNANRAAVLVVVRVAGRVVTLSPPSPGSNLWQGYLQGAGPAHGPLRVRPAGGRRLWFGSPELYPHAEVIAVLADGQGASTGDTTVLLHPGFG